MTLSDFNPYRWLAYGAAVVALLAFVFFQGMRHEQATTLADKLEATQASIQRRNANLTRAGEASTQYQGDLAVFNGRAATPLSPEIRSALQRPICPVSAASSPLSLPSLGPAQPVRLDDLLVPAVLIDGLRRAGSDPAEH